MKTVYILEKFESADTLRKDFEAFKARAEEAMKDGRIDTDLATNTIELFGKRVSENPDGLWSGVEGKANLVEFSQRAKKYIEEHPENEYRVVVGKIDDNVKYWAGYRMLYEVTADVMEFIGLNK